MGALAEAVQHLFEKPVFILLGVWVTNGWLDNRDLIVRENALAKSILAVALFECALPFDGHADHKVHYVWSEDGGILLWFFPDAVLVIAEHKDT
jgi:hypothetical protein